MALSDKYADQKTNEGVAFQNRDNDRLYEGVINYEGIIYDITIEKRHSDAKNKDYISLAGYLRGDTTKKVFEGFVNESKNKRTDKDNDFFSRFTLNKNQPNAEEVAMSLWLNIKEGSSPRFNIKLKQYIPKPA